MIKRAGHKLSGIEERYCNTGICCCGQFLKFWRERFFLAIKFIKWKNFAFKGEHLFCTFFVQKMTQFFKYQNRLNIILPSGYIPCMALKSTSKPFSPFILLTLELNFRLWLFRFLPLNISFSPTHTHTHTHTLCLRHIENEIWISQFKAGDPYRDRDKLKMC